MNDTPADAHQGWTPGPPPTPPVRPLAGQAVPPAPPAPRELSPDPEPPARRERPWWRQRRTIAEAVVLVLLLIAIGSSSASAEKDAGREADERIARVHASADKQVEEATAATAEAEDRAKATAAERDAALDRAAKAKETAEADAAHQLRRDEAALAKKWDDRNAALDQRSKDLDAREQQLAGREAAVARVEASQIGDGIYQVGVDMEPGRYHTDGSIGGCYIAMLSGSSGSFDEIINNDNFEGPATIDVHSAFFKSSGGCTWTKVG